MLGVISMSGTEIDRLEIITRVAAHELRQSVAAERLSMSIRHLQRLVADFRERGAEALVSKRRGKRSNRKLDDELRKKALDIIRLNYADFGPTLAHEKLVELHDIRVSDETVRTWMTEAGLWVPKKMRERRVYQPRRRRPCRGELIQIDGSPHDWFEDRGPRCTLLVFIDDATSEIGELRFVPSESTFDYFEATKSYLKRHGRPVAFYSDKHSIFRKAQKGEKEFRGHTQFGRVLEDLNIDIICANTPQAKGRVERSNRTLQDRLIKEMRLAGIDNIEDANVFALSYLGDYNRRFGKPPVSDIDAHRPLRETDDLDFAFCWREERTLSNNLVVQYKRMQYLIDKTPENKRHMRKKVNVHEWIDGTVEIWCDGVKLDYDVFDKLPTVNEAAIVENKRLGNVLSLCKEIQERKEEELMESSKLTAREKRLRRLTTNAD